MAWTMTDIDWSVFDAGRVDDGLLRLVKAAALVEANADDYVRYLRQVFADNPSLLADIDHWGEEECRHGFALGRWAEMADPAFDFDAARERFSTLYRVPQGMATSVRGSHAGELIARCVVECGTSSLYSAIRDATDEPVLRQISHRIAGDEFRHYQLFRRHLTDYPRPPAWRRYAVALGRVLEVHDDELASAWHAANVIDGRYDRRACARAYERHATRLYRRRHVGRMVNMVLKAVEVDPQGRLARWIERLAWRLLSLRVDTTAPAN